MPGDSLSSFPRTTAPEVVLPPTILWFLRLCLVAGLYNGFAFFAAILLRPLPHPPPSDVSSPFAFHVFAALLGAVFCLPVVMLPYWLALAFVYSRNEWARVLLYIGAGLMVLMTLGMAVRSGAGFLAMFGACVPGIAALVCLGLAPSRDWLRYTVPAFSPRGFGH